MTRAKETEKRREERLKGRIGREKAKREESPRRPWGGGDRRGKNWGSDLWGGNRGLMGSSF